MDAYSQFKPLRNKLKEFTAESVIELCTIKLHELKGFPVEQVKLCPPWFLLALIKWSVLYEDPDYHKRRNATVRDFGNLLVMLHRVFDAAPVPRGPSAVLLFLKNMSFQQLWLQDRLAAADFGRQIVLFEELPRTSVIRDLFSGVTGLDFATFTELASVLACRFLIDNSIYVDSGYYRPLGHPHDTIKRFLAMFALDPKVLKPFLEEEEKRVKDFEIKLYEQTPLKKRPLLMLDDGDRYLCYSPNLLCFALATFVYDKLKEHCPEAFSEQFGKVFESYVKKGLTYAEIEFFDEIALKERYPNSLVVDFEVVYPDAIILIEAKAIEVSPHARVSPDPRVISNNLRDSVIKAIKQGLAMATNLLTGKHRSPEGVTGKEIFLVIITYKDLFIGNGSDFLVNSPARQEIERFIRARNLDSRALKFEHIFFLSAPEFERLMYVVKQEKIGLATVLRRVLEANAAEKKLLFSQHLSHLYRSGAPPFITQPYERTISRVTQKLTSMRPG